MPGAVELDVQIGQVRALLAVIEARHFGEAADELGVTQQALSKRIQRLEQILGGPVLVRNGRPIELTDLGARFLPHARRLLDEAIAAAAVVTGPGSGPLRLDTCGPRMFIRIHTEMPDIPLALSMRRGMDVAIAALRRGEIDAALGRVEDLEHPLPGYLAHQVVMLERTVGAVPVDHPLADASVLTAADLASAGLWLPAAQEMPPEMQRFFGRYAAHLGVRLETGDHALGHHTDVLIETVRQEYTRVVLWSYDLRIPKNAGIKLIRLQPTPCYPWSLVWPRAAPNQYLPTLLERLTHTAKQQNRVHHDDWMVQPNQNNGHHMTQDEGERRSSEVQ